MSSPWGFRGAVYGLAALALAVLMIRFAVPAFNSDAGVPSVEASPGDHPKEVGDKAVTPAKAKLTFSELAALALTEGLSLEHRDSSLNPASESTSDRRALFALLRTGSDADAVKAIREFARLGGTDNCKQLSAIMKDDGWSDAVRTEAALALMKVGAPADARLAVRAMGVIGGDSNTATLTGIITDASLPQELRLEAALGLGNIRSPAAGDALVAAFGMFSDSEVHEQLLDTLGHFPFKQIEATWREYLADPDTPANLRVAAVEALATSTAESAEFLKDLAAGDRDPEVREQAAWAISAQGRNGALGHDLARLAAVEPEADVRRRLYEALPSQAENTAAVLLPRIQAETDIAARVAGYNALADAVKRSAPGELAAEFNGRIVRELTDIALSTNSLNIRMRAVFALRRARTTAATQALREISATQNPKIAQAASNGLQAANDHDHSSKRN